MTDESGGRQAAKPTPRLLRNFISILGSAMSIASAASILFLILIELLDTRSNPYLGILAYIILPGFLLLGLGLIFIGTLVERRRRSKQGASELSPFPVLDLNDARQRRRFLSFSGFTFLFLFISAFGSYRAYEFTDSVVFCGQLCHSVMNPEFVAYQASAHARVRCVDCHVGAGAGWYLRSKLSGAYQVYSVWFKKYPKPIPTPVHNLRPAQETCEQCHWPEKFFGTQLKMFNHYGFDEKNTLTQVRMLINTGGGSPEKGLVTGIHWHMNIANEITYIANDDHRQVIPWVQRKDPQGNVEEFVAETGALTPDQIASSQKRRMDCVECHNRPAHVYVPPDRAVNESMFAGKMDVSLPFLKEKSVELLSRRFDTTDAAVAAIARDLDAYYRDNYARVYSAKRDSIHAAVTEIQRIYKTYFFPEMNVDWTSHVDNIGHYYSIGCFRCHDGKHKTKTGKVIREDCNICHTVLDQIEGVKTIAVKNGSFQHPIDLGDLTGMKCTDCHTGKGLNE